MDGWSFDRVILGQGCEMGDDSVYERISQLVWQIRLNIFFTFNVIHLENNIHYYHVT